METTTKAILAKVRSASTDKLYKLGKSLQLEGASYNQVDRAISDFIKIEIKRLYSEAKEPTEIKKSISKIIHTFKADSRIEVIFANMMTENGIPYKFQYPIGSYRVDFLLNEYLVLEIDGPHHTRPVQIEHDSKRDKYLKKMGYEVLRIPLQMIALAPNAVIESLKELIRVENK